VTSAYPETTSGPLSELGIVELMGENVKRPPVGRTLGAAKALLSLPYKFPLRKMLQGREFGLTTTILEVDEGEQAKLEERDLLLQARDARAKTGVHGPVEQEVLSWLYLKSTNSY
jgi:hypothetical protein